jgi:hypothetical protein
MSAEPPKPKPVKSGAGKSALVVLAFAGGTAAGGAGAVMAFTWLGQLPAAGGNLFSIGFAVLMVTGLAALPLALPAMLAAMSAAAEAGQAELSRALLSG